MTLAIKSLSLFELICDYPYIKKGNVKKPCRFNADRHYRREGQGERPQSSQ